MIVAPASGQEEAADTPETHTVEAGLFRVEVELDGVLNEGDWRQPGEDRLIQNDPDNGCAPRHRTEFWVAYDDKAIYVAARMYDSAPDSIEAIRASTVEAARRRIRPCLMTATTTILALIPILTSTGRGSDIMLPMAIPSFGGMTVVMITIFVVPVLYCAIEEFRWKWQARNK